MNNQLFTEESRKELSRAERGAQYNHTASPKVWILLIGVFVFLTGFIVWALLGKIDIYVKVTGLVEDGVMYMYAYDEEDNRKLAEASYIRIDGQDYLVTYVDAENISSSVTNYLVCLESCYCENLKDDVYEGYAILGTCSPFTLIFGTPLNSAS